MNKVSVINFYYNPRMRINPTHSFHNRNGIMEMDIFLRDIPDFLSNEFYSFSEALKPFALRFDQLYNELNNGKVKRSVSKYHFDPCCNFNRAYHLETIPYNFKYGSHCSKFETKVFHKNHVANFFRYNNIIKDRPVLIIGNSPALNMVDLQAIKDSGIVTIGVNRACRVFTPDILVFSDKETLFSEYETHFRNFKGTLITNAAVYNNHIADGKKFEDLQDKTKFFSFKILNETKQDSFLKIRRFEDNELLGTLNFIETEKLGLQLILSLNENGGGNLSDVEFNNSMETIQNIVAAMTYYADIFESGTSSFPNSFHDYLRTVRSSTAMAMQIGYLCEPSAIGIIGIDFSILSAKKNNQETHFYGENNFVDKNHNGDSNEFMRLNFFRDFNKLMDKKKIPFYNLSPYEDTPINKIGIKKKKVEDFLEIY